MSPFLFSADLAATELGSYVRSTTTVEDATVASIFDEFRDARAEGRYDLMNLLRDRAHAIDPELVYELDGFDYPAAA